LSTTQIENQILESVQSQDKTTAPKFTETLVGSNAPLMREAMQLDVPKVDASDEKVETPAEPEKKTEASPEPRQEEKKARHFAALAREEKRLARERAALSREKAARKVELKELSRLKALDAKAKSDPLGAIRDAGIEYSALTEQLVNNGEPTDAQKIAALADELKATKADLRQKEADRIQKQKNAVIREEMGAIRQFQNEIVALVSKDPALELTRSFGASGTVNEVVVAHFRATGELMPIEKAAQMTETYLRSLVQKSGAAKKTDVAPEKPAKTNGAPRRMSDEQRMEAAIRAAGGDPNKAKKNYGWW